MLLGIRTALFNISIVSAPFFLILVDVMKGPNLEYV